VLNLPTPNLAVWPARLEYLSPLAALGLFALLAAPVILLGLRSLNGLGPTRRRVIIALRLLVTLVLVLLLGGLRWQRVSHDLEVMVLRDTSLSTNEATDFPGRNLTASLDDYLATAADAKGRPPDDKVGQISFQQDARIDALPNTHLALGTGSIRELGTNTNVAAAIDLGLATMQRDAMHRMLLISDGNANQGDTDAAVSAAKAAGVPIDVMPLHYDVQHEVLMDRFVAPTYKRENEPFTLYVYLKSTNDFPVTGKLTILHQGVPMDMDPATPGVQPTRQVTLAPGSPDHPSITPVAIKVPPLRAAGVHQFHANFEPDQPGAQVSVAGAGSTTAPAAPPAPGQAGAVVDTLSSNNSGDAFTYVQGKGRILYVDNVDEGGGDLLARSLASSGIDAEHIRPESFPQSLIELQNYDAVVLANVPFGPGGLTDQQQQNLATYVSDLGGGLAMIGGPDTFGAGGWQGKRLEEVLPVDMDIPASRQIPKGALVMLMHSCEFPNGNYFGEQCAIKAIETLSSQDEIGIVSYGWAGPQGGGSQFDFPLGPKGDGSKPIAAAKTMQVGDMPSFDDALTVALHGRAGSKGLIDSDAAQKHVIIISDGDPTGPPPALVAEYTAAKVSVSTICVYPHGQTVIDPTLVNIAKQLKGKAYGPINDNFAQLPQIFVKEATVVRRSLISEAPDGIPLHRRPTGSDIMRGIGDALPMVNGLVLTSRKTSPQVELPITAGFKDDPLLATWKTGLGRAAAYTSDATNKWGVRWVSSPDYDKFWAQLVRSVSRAPMSNQFDVNVTQHGDKGHIVVEGVDKDSGFADFLDISGSVVGPDRNKPAINEHLVQTGPGRYEGDFDMPDAGTYVAVMHYQGQGKESGNLPVAGLAQNTSPELRDLHSNDAALRDIAERTGGRVLPPFDAANADLFSRANLTPAVSSLPVWDRLIPVLLALILIDVAARRIAWDAAALRGYAASVAGYVRSFTTVRQVQTRSSLEALQKIRTDGATAEAAKPAPPPPARPDPKAKFTAKGVEGDIASVIGGATDKPIPKAPPKPQPPKGDAGGGMGSLMEAKRRAQAKIREKEQGDQGGGPPAS
jgi:Ca-activated chloride channel family protein